MQFCETTVSVEENRIQVVTDMDNLLIKFRASESVGNLKFNPRAIHISSFGAALISEIINEDGVNLFFNDDLRKAYAEAFLS